jgi:hypothetical protein
MTPGDRVAQLYPQAQDKKVQIAERKFMRTTVTHGGGGHSACSSSGNYLSFFRFIKNTQRFTFKMKTRDLYFKSCL